MPIHDHQPKFLGSAFLWGGIVLGVLLVAALLSHGFGIFGRGNKGDGEPAQLLRQGNSIVIPEGSALRKEIVVEPARSVPLNPQLKLPATVESDPARTAAVLSPLTGRLVALKVALGDRVARGQVLAMIDSADLGQAYDDNDKAADSFRLTKKNLEREGQQNKLGVASDKDLDQANSDFTQAEAEYTRTQERLKVLGAAAEHHGPERILSITAPVSGSVTALNAAVGTMINDPTQPLFTVADLSTVWVTAMVAEKDIAFVSKNQDAQVSLIAYPERVLKGKVLFVSDVLDADSRRNKLRIALDNRDYALKPNMFATVTVRGASREQVVLPSSALLLNNDRTSVFVATRPWTFERRTVETLLEEGNSVAILSGLQDGELVIVRGGILLND